MTAPHEHRCMSCGGAIACIRDGCDATRDARCLRCPAPFGVAIAVSPDGTPIGHVEPDGRFVPAITERERACLRGDHEAATDCDSTAGIAVWLGEHAAEAWVCRHCRAVFVPRSG